MPCLIRGGALRGGGEGIRHPFDGIFNIHVIHHISTFHTSGDTWPVAFYFGLNGPLSQYFSLYRAVSQREKERKEK